MKVRNIMFSGFAAAILMGTANAATTWSIASKAYVDGKFGDATSAASDVANTIGDMEQDLNNDNNSNFDNPETVVDALNDLDEAINTKQDALTAGDNIDITNNVISATYSTGTSAASGLTKLYDTTGQNTDGAMTQAAVTSALGTLGTHTDEQTSETVPNTVEYLLDGKQDKLGGGNDAGKVVTATGTAGTVDYTAIDTAVGTGSNLITSGAVKTYVDTAIQNVTGGDATIGVLDDGNGGTYNSVAEALAAKQDKSASTVANGTYNQISQGNGVAANLVALDTVVGKHDAQTGQGTGLAHDVAVLQSAVGDSNSGLAADVDALEEKVGDGQLASGFSGGVDDLTDAVNDLQSTKQDAITSQNNLMSDLVDDTNQTHKFVTGTDVTNLGTLATLISEYSTCAASSQSGRCVLSASTSGMEWVDVTFPYVEGQQAPAPTEPTTGD